MGGVCLDTGKIPSKTFREAEVLEDPLRRNRVPLLQGQASFVDAQGLQIRAAEGPPHRAVLLLESGKRIVSDVILFSVGRIPATAPLHLSGGFDDFLETVFNDPTLAECYKVAAYDAANKLVA